LAIRIVWGFYAVLAAGFSVLAAVESLKRGFLHDLAAALVNGCQVAVGLLLVCVGASAPLAEERASGSLDLVLSTPLSLDSVLRAKWWGTFRGILVVALLPTGVAAVVGFGKGDWLVPALTFLLILAWGAWLTSLGLAMATWVSRPARAVIWSVCVYALVAVGWPILIGVTATHDEVGALASASPPFGSLFVILDDHYSTQAPWLVSWAVVFAFAAFVLFRAARSALPRRLDLPRERARGPGRSGGS
jgi:ABC-type transport system involved in multi-copper enzyme maturation permease subunit